MNLRKHIRWAGRGAVLISGFVLALEVGMLAGQGASKSVNDGVYSVDQAARGQKVFETTCTICHDTGRFTGKEFVAQWSGQPLYAFFDVMRKTMPEDNPGSLQVQQYADVVSYILQLNQFPSGAGELMGTEEAMSVVKMEEPKAGPDVKGPLSDPLLGPCGVSQSRAPTPAGPTTPATRWRRPSCWAAAVPTARSSR
jgi:S-disulfanyl-L-cysteine oxidoreductase SoxD